MNTDQISVFGFFIAALLLIPHIINIRTARQPKSSQRKKLPYVCEQIGRYASMLLMVLHIGMRKFYFRSEFGIYTWLIGIPALVLLYWILWFLYFKAPARALLMILAVIPSVIFLTYGIVFRHWLLIFFGAVFAVCHLRATYRDNFVKHGKQPDE